MRVMSLLRELSPEGLTIHSAEEATLRMPAEMVRTILADVGGPIVTVGGDLWLGGGFGSYKSKQSTGLHWSVPLCVCLDAL